MHPLVTILMTTLALGAADAGTFELKTAPKDSHGAKASKLEPSKTHAAMRFVVVEKDKGPVKGVVVVMTAPDGTKYYTDETDADGYGEVLVPVGKKYEITYLSLGRKDIAASVTVTDEPKQNVKLTLRFKRLPPPPPFVLTGIVFDTGKASIRPESTTLLDVVADFMSHKKSAKIEIAGHTDDVGKASANQVLSEKRAQACRAYLISKGIEGPRIKAVGFGGTRPITPNTSDEARQKNRRIEVVEQQAP
jgi:outer membrane protein OmpA-like peptidoglycan-associated protein